MSLQEWQKHINRTDQDGTSWCGQRIDAEWHFVDADHALLTVAQGQRLQPCPTCVDVLMEVMKRVDRGHFPPLMVNPYIAPVVSTLSTAQRNALARDLGIDIAAAKRAGIGLGMLDPEAGA